MANRLNQIQQYLNSQKANRIAINRNMYPVNRNQLRDHIYDRKYREIIDKCFDLMAENKHIFHHGDIEDYSKEEERERGAQMVLAYHKLRPVNTLNIETDPHSVSVTSHAAYYFDPGFVVRTDITLFLYCKTLMAFRREDSAVHQAFIRSALTAQHIGCFGLTEIGHGSDTKNIQTEAIYDPTSRGLLLNTPSEAALKFWIGGAAQTASHGVIWAQLVIKGKKYGVHPFIVPMRDRKTMKVYEGVIIGDCGSKIGLHLIDNGYIGFKNYRIPLQNALDRISGVDANGQFRTIESNPQKRHGMYMGPLSIGRSFITINSMASSLNALLIAIKYSCTRRQFESASKQQQQLLIDYPLVQFRLMPLLASAFVCFVGGASILRSYDDNFKEMLKPKSKVANELHGISAAAKARSSWLATEIIGTCRHLLGGHGYSGFSRLGRLYFDQQINTTWQGDNHMLLQQSVKYVLKTVKKLKQSPDQHNVLNFVNDEIVLPYKWDRQSLLSVDNLLKILQKRLLGIHDQLINFMFELKADQIDSLDVWNQGQSYHGKKLALLYCDLHYFTVYRRKAAGMQLELKQLSEQSLRLWVCYNLEKDRWGTPQTRVLIQQIIRELCQWLTPRSVSLVEALAAPEAIVGSPFADWNGDQMWQKYLGLIYGGKDTFSRVPYYQQIIDGRNC